MEPIENVLEISGGIEKFQRLPLEPLVWSNLKSGAGTGQNHSQVFAGRESRATKDFAPKMIEYRRHRLKKE
jgi:hypothetical protein